jgi:hypothetical protein
MEDNGPTSPAGGVSSCRSVLLGGWPWPSCIFPTLDPIVRAASNSLHAKVLHSSRAVHPGTPVLSRARGQRRQLTGVVRTRPTAQRDGLVRRMVWRDPHTA